jgi:serine/threonine protein kinase
MLQPQTQIGPYTLTTKIGEGNFGVVWLGERRTSIVTTRFALKFPKDADLKIEAIKQEAEVWMQASGHPNVLPIIEAEILNRLQRLTTSQLSFSIDVRWRRADTGSFESL